MVGSSSSIIQALVNSEENIRENAHKQVLIWLSSNANKCSFESMLKLWKALLRSLWMTDTLEKQERLTDLLSRSCISILGGPSSETSLKYGTAFLNAIASEWEYLDNLRLDKFYLLMRKMGPLAINSFLCFIKDGRVDAKPTPASISFFIIENILSFYRRKPKSLDVDIHDFLVTFVKLYLVSKDEVLASRIKKNILDNCRENPFLAQLPLVAHEISNSSCEGYIRRRRFLLRLSSSQTIN